MHHFLHYLIIVATIMSASAQGILSHLQEASAGLLFPSETDAPFTCFVWDDLHDISVPTLLMKTGNKTGTPVEEISLEQLFSGVTRIAEWMSEDERAEALRFQELQQTLEDLLYDVRVFRIGAMDIDVYVVGITESGVCAGVSTQIVET